MRGKKVFIGLRALAILAMTLLVTSTLAATNWHEKVLNSFNTGGPLAGLIFDAAGNLYGTNFANNGGQVFELTPDGSGGWTETVLYSFCSLPGCTDGSGPIGGLILDAAGNLYGTNLAAAFELIKPQPGGNWTEQVLHDFGGGNDGFAPYAGLIFDAAGNLYGTTYYGGTSGQHCNGGSERCGTVFELTPSAGGGWTETVLHDFGNGSDGADPYADLILDSVGNLYGTTQHGGANGYGTVFELTPISTHVYPCAVCGHGALQ